MRENKKFLLYSSCILVKGSNRSVICDLQRNCLYPIPNTLFGILKRFEGQTVADVKASFSNEYDEAIDNYFDTLEINEVIHYTDNPDLFPPLSLEWDEPWVVTNAIADVARNFEYCASFIEQLKQIGCHTLQIRFFHSVAIDRLKVLLSSIDLARISSIELILKYDPEHLFTPEKIQSLCEEFRRISIITVFDAPYQNSYHFRPDRFGNVFYIKSNISSEKCCGMVGISTFTINIKTFTESRIYNTCLNRKISIDIEGNIKNCPSMPESYGNIKDTTLKEALEKPGFKKYWNITKDQVSVCKDCEFRYICTDCRAYLENPEDIYSKPLKCGYNPYTGVWEEWSTNPLKKKAIEYYGMEDLVKEVKFEEE